MITNMIDPLNMHFVCTGDLRPKPTDGVSTPALVITNTLWRELEYFTKVVFKDIEYAVFLTIDRPSVVKPLWIADGFFMPKQEISISTVSIDMEDVRQFMAEKSYLHHRNLCHWHSHNHMNAFWSNTDITEQEDRSELGFLDNYRFYVVVNNRGQYECDCVTYDPFKFRTGGIPIYTTGEGAFSDNELTAERKEALAKMAEEKCVQVSDNTTEVCFNEYPQLFLEDDPKWKSLT